MPAELGLANPADRIAAWDVARGRTLPGWSFTDPAVWSAEKKAIFFRHWQYVCHESALTEPGDYVTTAIFDQDVFLARGHDGEVRAFYNVCAHRGHPLVEGRGRKGRLVCPYHAWTYDLTGRLIGARASGQTEGFVKADICLSAVRVDRLLGFLFVNLDPAAPPLAEYAAGLEESIRAAVPGVDGFRPQQVTWQGREVACNWKILLDNYLECYHCEGAHPTFSALLDVTGTRHDFGANWSGQHIPRTRDLSTAPYPLNPDRDLMDGDFWFLYPNTTFGYLPGSPNLAVSRVEALSVETCRRYSHVYGPPGLWTEADEARSRWATDYVVAEDVALCEGVQRGMRSRGFEQGLYIVNPDDEECTEECLRFFHRRYAEDMALR